MEAALALAPDPESAAAARALVDETLPDWGCDELRENARLVITELVSNAVRHAGPPIEVMLELRPRALRLAVADGDSGDLPHWTNEPRPPSWTDLGGRGLLIVGQLADEWGVEPGVRGGKVVWAEWRLPLGS
jgi:anti-sigma regulatory factor (Ser/Thr protein kinase)